MRTRIDLRCDATRITRLSATGLLSARPLPSNGGVLRVALVQTAASLLRGDEVHIDVRLGPGARLELIDVAALIAQNVRGGDGATLDIDLRLADGARLSWAAQPLVLCAGCRLTRRSRVTLGADAAMLARDTVVLGRAGEEPGALRSELTVEQGGRELHVETLDTSDLALLRSPVVAGDAKVLDTLALYGARAEDAAALQLAAAGSMLPLAAVSLAASEATLGPLARRWSAALLATDGPSGLARTVDGPAAPALSP